MIAAMTQNPSSTTVVNGEVLSAFAETKLFNYHKGASITSMDFDDSGQYLISAGVDKSIQLYDIHRGLHHKDVQLQKYGAHLARFTHSDLNCLYALTPGEDRLVDHAIRNLSLGDNRYIRYFKSHKDQVTSIEVNPIHGSFLSSSLDLTVKLWDLACPSPMGNIEVATPLIVCYDPQGIVFATASYVSGDYGTLNIYDLASFDKGPFLSTQIPGLPCQKWLKIEFSNNGKTILISTNSAHHYLIDAFLGKLLTTLVMLRDSQHPDERDWMNTNYPLTGPCTFSPCGKYVIAGSPRREVCVFDLASIKTSDGNTHRVDENTNPKSVYPIKRIPATQGAPKIAVFNPKLLVLATADNTVQLWQPES